MVLYCLSVLYILGDRENGVDARYLTPHTVDDSTARTGRSSDDGRPVIVKQARTFSKAELIERTRCELLHGNDRWICIDCGIMVSSLTMACGMCGKNISFIPLEYPEFEDFRPWSEAEIESAVADKGRSEFERLQNGPCLLHHRP